MTESDLSQFQALGISFLGRSYQLGAKWRLDEKEPFGPIDCSGLSRYLVYRCKGVVIPDGSYNQIKVCHRLPEEQQDSPPPLSLGFYAKPGEAVDHVVVVFDKDNVIEARGQPYGSVILRPIAKWLAMPGWKGFYSAPLPEANV